MSEPLVYRIVIDPAVNDRMAAHFEFLARVSGEAAYTLLDGLLDDIGTLTEAPLRNPVYERPHVPALKYRYMLSQKRYRIVYQVAGRTVFIDDIQDCRQHDDKNRF